MNTSKPTNVHSNFIAMPVSMPDVEFARSEVLEYFAVIQLGLLRP